MPTKLRSKEFYEFLRNPDIISGIRNYRAEKWEPAMSHKWSRAGWIRLTAAAGACAAAATIWAASAPTARADDLTQGVQDIASAAQADFSLVAADFASGTQSGDAAGLTYLVDGIDDELLGVPSFYEVGATDLLFNQTVIPPTDFEYDLTVPTLGNFGEATAYYDEGTTLLADAENAEAGGNFAVGALDHAEAVIDSNFIPGELIAIAQAEFALQALPLLLNGL
jgi:hypothetical protein